MTTVTVTPAQAQMLADAIAQSQAATERAQTILAALTAGTSGTFVSVDIATGTITLDTPEAPDDGALV